jgi:hypothetical protein
MMWLYLTGAAVLIGGELNSELEKAEAECGQDHEIRRTKTRQTSASWNYFPSAIDSGSAHANITPPALVTMYWRPSSS